MLHIHRAERADGLAAALGELLSAPLEDPFASEIVAVPTRGMERWLSQQLSRRLGASPDRNDGVCANVLFPSPRRLLSDAVAAASGVDPDQDPWRPEHATWPLLEVVDARLREPWLRPLATYLGCANDPPDPVRWVRRLGVIRHLADLFDRYAHHRPAMMRAWAAGQDADGSAGQLRQDAIWQAELWRALRSQIGMPGPAERLETACAQLREEPSTVELPVRLTVFGLTRLPAGDLDVLRALAAGRDIHLFLLHPSPGLWEAISAATKNTPPTVRRTTDPTADLPANDVLRSWGRDSREMQLVLTAEDEHVSHHHELRFGSATLLERIQADIRADRRPLGPPLAGKADRRPQLDPGDRSLQIHACHGRARQVEVLRDAILHLLVDDPSLEPRDVIVMCPDIESFAPLINATFGVGAVTSGIDGDEPAQPGNELVDLRVRLADRSLRQTNPLLAITAELLELGDQRVTASQVLDFADRGPVRQRFEFGDDDLTRLQGWIAEAGIRWGLDAAHRAPFKLDQLRAGTWRAGLDRLLLGVTMTEDRQRVWSGVLPLDDVDSGVIDLAGRFAELIARVGEAIDTLGVERPIAAWAPAIAHAADTLAASRAQDAWQRAELERVLDEMVKESTGAGTVAQTSVTLAEVRGLLADRLAGRPTRANFRTGHLTVCTLYPMRSVPHRVVCLLGLDDGAFPRKAPRDGDDLMLDDPHIGERDPRSEDRQLLLDALLAATERLVITYTGNDERTNIPRPPAVPVGELLDVVDATVRATDGPARRHIEVRHPLQRFDPRNFDRGELVTGTTWAFDRVTLEGARALDGPRAAPGPFVPEPLPALEAELIELEQLVRFVQHPVRAFLRRRLQIAMREISDEIEDALPIELDALQLWGVGQRLLDARLAGVDGRAAIQAEIARGTLPPGVLGKPVIRDLYPVVDAILSATRALIPEGVEAEPLDVRVELPDGRMLSGTVAAVHGEMLLATTYSRVSSRHRLTAWVRLLAATASAPERPLSAVTIGRASARDKVSVARIETLGTDPADRRRFALDQLTALIELYDRGMREPLPIYCATSGAFAQAAADGRDAIAAAHRAWTSNYKFAKEDTEPEHRLVLGGIRTLDELLAVPPKSDEQAPGWDVSESSRFGRYAHRLWDGLLRREEVATW